MATTQSESKIDNPVFFYDWSEPTEVLPLGSDDKGLPLFANDNLSFLTTPIESGSEKITIVRTAVAALLQRVSDKQKAISSNDGISNFVHRIATQLQQQAEQGSGMISESYTKKAEAIAKKVAQALESDIKILSKLQQQLDTNTLPKPAEIRNVLKSLKTFKTRKQ